MWCQHGFLQVLRREAGVGVDLLGSHAQVLVLRGLAVDGEAVGMHLHHIARRGGDIASGGTLSFAARVRSARCMRPGEAKETKGSRIAAT